MYSRAYLTTIALDLETVPDEEPCISTWFRSRLLASVHAHPRDCKVQYIHYNQRYYIHWLDNVTLSDTDLNTTPVLELVRSSLENHSSQCAPMAIVDHCRQIGKTVHTLIEILLNSTIAIMAHKSYDPYREQFTPYFQTLDQHHFRPWRTEMPIYTSVETKVMGIVDAIFLRLSDPNDGVLRLYIRDWKYSNQTSLHVEEHTRQLQVYGYILNTYYQPTTPLVAYNRTYTSLEVVDLRVVFFHPSLPTPYERSIPLNKKLKEIYKYNI